MTIRPIWDELVWGTLTVFCGTGGVLLVTNKLDGGFSFYGYAKAAPDITRFAGVVVLVYAAFCGYCTVCVVWSKYFSKDPRRGRRG